MADDSRRHFLKLSTFASVGALAVTAGKKLAGQDDASKTADSDGGEHQDLEKFSRYAPSYGGSVGSDTYLGKLVPGLRPSGLPPVPVISPDVPKLPWKTIDGRKEYHLYAEHVRRELLPGNWMNLWGFNGSVPGPVLEAFQGDKIRLVVHNHYPEMMALHWHGGEMDNEFDGAETLTQKLIEPGETFAYEYDLHQTGTFFYHSHVPMQEAFGAVGFFIIHPKIAFDPPVDRDFALHFQNWMIDHAQTTADTVADAWNWHGINGRLGPYTTPLVVKHGERVRIRILDFSPIQHHPIHLHGHTFWVTGHEGARIPESAWIPRNTELIAVAQASDLEFVANNPGDWFLHCHMAHHMMNHMVRQSGPRIREGDSVDRYMGSLTMRPKVKFPHTDSGFAVPGYPQMRMSKEFSVDELAKIHGRREVRGMRAEWHKAVKGMMTVVRVLPEDLYNKVMHSHEVIEPGQIFQAVVEGRKKSPAK